ncbi:MAG TPA: glycosyltransferase family 87 protein [Patescibacteria group bacterium]|nr:glycosyltransferase family 87 protein [Patescibacteria group bacterium]
MDVLKKVLPFIFFITTLLWLSKALFLHNYPDFNVFYGGLHTYLAGGNPYLQVQGSSMKFLYPPFALYFFFPLILFSRSVASIVWVALSIIFLILSIVLLFKIQKQKIISSQFCILSGLIFLMFPVKFNLGMGQFNNVNLLLISLAMYFFVKHRQTLSGISLGLSLLLKVFPFLLVFYFLIIKKWKLTITIFITVLLGMLFGAVVISWPLTVHFLTSSLFGTLKSWPLDYYNQALSGLLGRSLGVGEAVSRLKIVITAILLAITLTVVWHKRNNSPTYLLGIASILPLSLMTLSFSWQHYFVLVIPALVLLYFHYQKIKASRVLWGLLALSYGLIGFNLAHPESVPVLLRSHVFFGTSLLFILLLREVIVYD